MHLTFPRRHPTSLISIDFIQNMCPSFLVPGTGADLRSYIFCFVFPPHRSDTEPKLKLRNNDTLWIFLSSHALETIIFILYFWKEMFLWIQFKMGQRFHAGYVNFIYKKNDFAADTINERAKRKTTYCLRNAGRFINIPMAIRQV